MNTRRRRLQRMRRKHRGWKYIMARTEPTDVTGVRLPYELYMNDRMGVHFTYARDGLRHEDMR